jgi:tetratricopeptide (TPR) repeat protein
MTKMKEWRILKMSISEFQKLVLLCLVTFVLSACSTGALKPTPTKAENETETKQENPVKNEGVETVVERAPFLGPDPMADIQINPEIKKAYSDIAKLNKNKKFAQALTLMETIQAKYPQLSGPDYQRARIYYSQANYEEALKAVDESIKNNPRNYYSLNLKGIVLREMGKFEEAKQVYFEAINVYPPYPNSHLNLGVLLDLYMRNLELALLQYREYMHLTGGNDKKVANWIIEIERRIKAGK